MNQEHDPLPTAEDGNREVVRAARRAFLAWWATNPVHGADEDALGEMRATAWAGWKAAALAAQAVPAADAEDDACSWCGYKRSANPLSHDPHCRVRTHPHSDFARAELARLPASAPAAPVSEACGQCHKKGALAIDGHCLICGWEPDAPAAPVSEAAVREALEWLRVEISAVDPWYRGSPTYIRDGAWMKDRADDLIGQAIELFAATPKGQEPSNAEEGNHGDR